MTTDARTIRSDAFQEFRWSEKTQRYTVRSGAGRSQFISREAYQNRLGQYVRSQQQQLVGLADSLVEGAIDLPTFQRKAARTIADLHASFALQHIENLTNTEQKIILRRVQEQLYAGKDWQTGRSYGVRSIAIQLKNGELSPAQFRARMAAYGEAGRLTAAEVEVSIARRQGKAYGVRKMTGGHQHCNECPGLQMLMPVAIEQIVLIGDRCSCRVRCKCVIQQMDLTEAIQVGMKDPRKGEKRKRELEAIDRLTRRR